jgi:hypothetical protein
MLENLGVFAFFAAFCEKWRGFTEGSKGSEVGVVSTCSKIWGSLLSLLPSVKNEEVLQKIAKGAKVDLLDLK